MTCTLLNPTAPASGCRGSVSNMQMPLLVADAEIAPPHSRSCHAKFKLDTKV